MDVQAKPRETKNNILILTQFFPPVLHTASQRCFSFYEYLKSENFSVNVVAPLPATQTGKVDEPSAGVYRFARSREHWRSPAVVRKDTGKLKYYFLLLKNFILEKVFLNEDPGFTAQLVLEGERQIFVAGTSILLTSHGPISVLLAGLEIKKRNPKLYWVCDLRDELSTHPAVPWWKKSSIRKLEQEIWKEADLVIGVSKPIVDDFKKNCRNQSLEFLEVTNGSSLVLDKGSALTRTEKIRIGYFGSFYGSIKPANFFQALLEMKREAGELSFVVDIYGHYGFIPVPKDLEDHVVFHGVVPYDQLQSLMALVDIFLLIGPRSQRKGVYTSKLFDYLFINRPILGLVPPDDVAAQLIRETRSGSVAALEDIPGIKNALAEIYRSLQDSVQMDKNWDLILKFSRANQVEKLGTHLIKILEQEPDRFGDNDSAVRDER